MFETVLPETVFGPFPINVSGTSLTQVPSPQRAAAADGHSLGLPIESSVEGEEVLLSCAHFAPPAAPLQRCVWAIPKPPTFGHTRDSKFQSNGSAGKKPINKQTHNQQLRFGVFREGVFQKMPALEGQFLKEISVRFAGENHLRTQKNTKQSSAQRFLNDPFPKTPFFSC